MSEIQKFDEYKSQITRILTTMFDYLSLEGTFTVEERGQKIGVKIASEDAGRIIGRKGQTLDSLQLILNRILFKQDENCPHVMLDIDGYAGGAVFAQSSGTKVSVKNATFTGNNAQAGGAIYAGSNSTMTVDNTYFAGNTAKQGNYLQCGGKRKCDKTPASFKGKHANLNQPFGELQSG